MIMTKPFSTLFLILVLLSVAGVCLAQRPGTESQKSSEKGRTPAQTAAGYFPNTILITQDNQKVKFYDDLLKDKLVVINFMFTTCTAICPPMTANLKKVQTLLGERSTEVSLISISVDPLTDTPERLKDYANKFRVQPGWYFLTGDKANVDVVLRKLGGHVADKNEHAALLIIGNVATGEWKKVYALAKPTDIATQINQLLDSRTPGNP